LPIFVKQIKGKAYSFNLPLGCETDADRSIFALVVLEQIIDGERPHQYQTHYKQIAGEIGDRRTERDGRAGL
jgi:hypothetical protein